MLPLHLSPSSESHRRWIGRPLIRWIVLSSFVATVVWVLSSQNLENDYPKPWPAIKFQEPESPGIPTSVWEERAIKVRNAYLHALSGYKKHAYPDDELLSVSGRSSSKFNGWAVTLIDSLDTMWIMGLKKEFAQTVDIVAKQKFLIPEDQYAPFFETVIRYLGGLLSAYALSGNPILLARADDLGGMLLPAFNGTPSGLPAFSVNPQTGYTGMGWFGHLVLFAEVTSCQLEYKYLAKLTGKAEYYRRAQGAMDAIYKVNPVDGLFATTWTPDALPDSARFTVGASTDSGYEYFLKQYLLTGDLKARSQYLKSIDGIMNRLLFLTQTRKLLYITDMTRDKPSHHFEHLSCFLPGVLALGAHLLDLPSAVKERHEWAAKGLAHTCWITYADQRTGLGPDGMRMAPGDRWVDALERWEAGGRRGVVPGLGEGPAELTIKGRDYVNSPSIYLLRPETIESMYILWRVTGDVKWRERGFAIFLAIEKFAKTEYGYASISSVDHGPPRKIDDMPSYFLAETLKYLYLLFSDTDPFPLDQWVFNTEAHPLPVFRWSDDEMAVYDITL